MGARVEAYRAALREVLDRGDDLGRYLATHFNLPGPRGNPELAAAAAEELDQATLEELAAETERWARGSRLEQRAAAAVTCEPRLLRDSAVARRVLAPLDAITATLPVAPHRRTDGFRALRQTLGYCWSVAIAADPVVGLQAFDRWRSSPDPDVALVIRENLRKARLRAVLDTRRR